MKNTLVCFLIIFTLFCFGCASHKSRPKTISASIDDKGSIQTILNSIDQNIRFIKSVIEKKDISGEDRIIASDLLKTYKTLQNRLTNDKSSDQKYLDILCDTYNCLSSLDKRYFSRTHNVSDSSAETTILLLTTRKEDILGAYVSGDYKNVIELSIDLKTDFGTESLTQDIGLLFAISLAKNDMLDEAIDIGEKIAKKLETRPDLIQLRINIAEWYLQKGQREKAIHIYEKLADSVDEHETIAHALRKKISTSESVGSDIKHQIPDHIELERLEVGIDHQLERVDKLLEEDRFNEARDLLVLLRRKTLSSDEINTVDQASKKLEVAEENYLEKKISMISMKRDMEQARKLIEEERFEEVILRLEAMESDQEETREIKELKQFAIEKLINRERNRAATVFLTAKGTDDIAKKQTYLLEALGILKALIDEYQVSSLNAKLLSNIKTVEEELNKLEIKVEKAGEQ